MTRHVGQRGAVGGIEVLWFGTLVFVSVMLLVVNAWAVLDAELAVSSAAREAARAYVEAEDEATARSLAATRAEDALRAYGRFDPERVAIDEPLTSGPFGRCARVSFTAHYRVPALTVPFLGGFGRSITASATHSEIVDPFRDGLPAGGCP
jgi:hypothetical protein